ncbi:hypothetical protein [Clostridium scatologenes]|uniref:Uncharacterized protein n=1 Tax=Clostridium scatologenes TaxID=1548 RepID=A0A0E3JZ61_CLOSL|nr:hypothetical protein [Clostridium scatologenes]AKA69505.1 hypothetical protein CSCA_2380 [Clostridium scatologenes]
MVIYLRRLDNLRSAYNENSKFEIDGKEFKLDSTGSLNVPEGTIRTSDRVKMTK